MNEHIEVVKAPTTGIFTNYIYKAIPLAFDESMSYYETLCGLLAYLKDTIIPTVNNNADAIIELQENVDNFETNITNLFNELQSYVDNYFNNLDVQEEINNKLDDMVEQGTLQEIITGYLNSRAIFGFDNVALMKASTNLIDGSYAQTMGFHSKNDGGNALYKIRKITNDDVVNEMNKIAITYDNTLIAELITITNNYINVKQLGAYGDDSHNDYNALNTAISLYKNIYIPNGTYIIDNELNITSNYNIKCTGTLKNTDGDVLVVNGASNNIEIKRINASNNGITLKDTNSLNFNNYFVVDYITAGNNAIFVQSTLNGINNNTFIGKQYNGTENAINLDLPSSAPNTAYITELIFENMILQCTNGAGFYANNHKTATNSQNLLSSHKLINVRFEGVHNCYHLINSALNKSSNIRTNESITGNKLILSGKCENNNLDFGIIAIGDINVTNNTGSNNKITGQILNDYTLYYTLTDYLIIDNTVMRYTPFKYQRSLLKNLNQQSGGPDFVLNLNSTYPSIYNWIICQDVVGSSVKLGGTYCSTNMIGVPIVIYTGQSNIVKDMNDKIIINTSDTQYQNYKKVAITLMGIDPNDNTRYWKKEIIS